MPQIFQMNHDNMPILTQLHDSWADFEHIYDLLADYYTSNSMLVNQFKVFKLKNSI